MKRKEAKGQIQWIDEECVGFKCECGEEFLLDIPFSSTDMNAYDECSRCGKKYILDVKYIAYEIE